MARKRSGVRASQSNTKVKIGLSLTPTSVQSLNDLAQQAKLSRSELVDRIARGRIAISGHSAEMAFILKTSQAAKNQVSAQAASANVDIQVVSAEAQLPSQATEPEEQGVSLETHNCLQQESAKQAGVIRDLQQQTVELRDQLERQLAEETPPQTSLASWQQKSLEQANTITDLNWQIAELRNQLKQQVTKQAAQQQSHEFLQHRVEQQVHIIADLHQQVHQLRCSATIGETYLNKWRHRLFSY